PTDLAQCIALAQLTCESERDEAVRLAPGAPHLPEAIERIPRGSDGAATKTACLREPQEPECGMDRIRRPSCSPERSLSFRQAARKAEPLADQEFQRTSRELRARLRRHR